MQRIFSSAPRRETLGGRRGGELKIDWTKPVPRAWPMCIDCRLDLWQGSEGAGSGEPRGARAWFVGLAVASSGVDGQDLSLGKWA